MNVLADLIIKEGWRPIGFAAGASLLCALADWDLLAWGFLIAAGYGVLKYRKPVRAASYFEKGSVTAPCDGKVTAIETLSDGSVTVEIKTGWRDASLLTMPFAGGTMTHRSLTRGARLGCKSGLCDLLNEQGWVIFEDVDGRGVRMTHMLSYTPAPLVLDSFPSGKRHLRGERYGVLTHGVTRIYLPPSTRVAVNPGETVFATQTLLGYMR